MSASSGKKPICFVISPIGSEKSDVRSRADKILNHVIKPIAEECGFETLRADKISEPGIITSQVIQHILQDEMVVADLTDENANVFYELAVRHLIRKPYVQMIQSGQRIPFDTAGVRTIQIDHTDLDSVALGKAELKKQIEYTAANPDKVQNPVSASIDLEVLKESDDPERRQIADLLTAVNEIKRLIGNLNAGLSTVLGFNANFGRSEGFFRTAGGDVFSLVPAHLTPPGGFTQPVAKKPRDRPTDVPPKGPGHKKQEE